MTDTPQMPENTPAETPTQPFAVGAAPTAPLPPTAPTPAVAPTATPPSHSHHAEHRLSDGAIAAIIIGGLLAVILAFAMGWAARGFHIRAQFAQRGFMMGAPGYSQQYGRGYGYGYGYDQGQGQGQGYGYGQGQDYGYGQGQGQGYGYGHGYGGRGMMRGYGYGQVPGGQIPTAAPVPNQQ